MMGVIQLQEPSALVNTTKEDCLEESWQSMLLIFCSMETQKHGISQLTALVLATSAHCKFGGVVQSVWRTIVAHTHTVLAILGQVVAGLSLVFFAMPL